MNKPLSSIFEHNYKALNLVVFQFAWFLVILGGNVGALIALVIFFSIHVNKILPNEGRYIVQVAVLGWFFDAILFRMGLIFSSGANDTLITYQFPPYWLTALWLMFAASLNHGFSFLAKDLRIAAILGLFAGPLNYMAGAKLAGLQLGDFTQFCLFTGVGWALMLPLFALMSRRQVEQTSSMKFA